MVIATRAEILKVTPFPKFWPNFAEDIQFSKEIHKLGFLNAYIYPDKVYAIHEHVTNRATENPSTFRNVLLHEGITYYLEADNYDNNEISRPMAIKRLCAYNKDNIGVNLTTRFFDDFRKRVLSFLEGKEEPLREMGETSYQNEWLKYQSELISYVANYLSTGYSSARNR